jgi:hypothetical protein
MKLVPSILLAVFTFLTVFGFLHGDSSTMAGLFKAAGPLGLVAFAIGYGIDVLIFVVLARRAIGRGGARRVKD